jgi:membrane protein implicated in regulation of membrane protease activity
MGGMAGGIVMVVALLLFPVVFLMAMAGVAAALGVSLKKDSDARYEGTELHELS